MSQTLADKNLIICHYHWTYGRHRYCEINAEGREFLKLMAKKE